MQKLDPYINVDPGTMNPFEHGEVFVTDDAGETDLDLGHYERFIDESLSRASSATTGSIYQSVLAGASRRVPRSHGAGDPAHHRRDQTPYPAHRHRGVGRRHHRGRRHRRRHRDPAVPGSDTAVPEGGTDNILLLHVTLVPFVGPTGEQKTKPTSTP